MFDPHRTTYQPNPIKKTSHLRPICLKSLTRWTSLVQTNMSMWKMLPTKVRPRVLTTRARAPRRPRRTNGARATSTSKAHTSTCSATSSKASAWWWVERRSGITPSGKWSTSSARSCSRCSCCSPPSKCCATSSRSSWRARRGRWMLGRWSEASKSCPAWSRCTSCTSGPSPWAKHSSRAISASRRTSTTTKFWHSSRATWSLVTTLAMRRSKWRVITHKMMIIALVWVLKLLTRFVGIEHSNLMGVPRLSHEVGISLNITPISTGRVPTDCNGSMSTTSSPTKT